MGWLATAQTFLEFGAQLLQPGFHHCFELGGGIDVHCHGVLFRSHFRPSSCQNWQRLLSFNEREWQILLMGQLTFSAALRTRQDGHD
jgi:hypothetical protein